MNMRHRCVRWALLAALSAGLSAMSEASARAGRGHGGGGHGGGGHAYRAPRVSAPRGGFKAPRMPRIKSPARASSGRTHSHTSKQLALNTTGASRRGMAGPANPGSTAGTGKINPGSLSGTGFHAVTWPSQCSDRYCRGRDFHQSTRHLRKPVYVRVWPTRSSVPSVRLRLGLPESLLRSRLRLRKVAGVQPRDRGTAAIGAYAARADRSRLSGSSRSGHACDFNGDPATVAPIDGLQRRGFRTRNEQRPGHGYGRGNGNGPGRSGRSW